MLAVEGLEPAATRCTTCSTTARSRSPCPWTARWPRSGRPAGAAGVQAVLELTDYAPLPLREPVRSLVWIRGRLHDVPAGEVPALLDLIATENPNPALLQVNTGDTGVAATPATRCCGSRSSRWSSPTPPAPKPSGCQRCCSARGRTRSARWSPAGCTTWNPPTARWSPGWPSRLPAPLRRGRVRPLGPGPLRRPAAGRERGRRPRRPAAVRQAGRRRDRAEPGDPRADGLPVPQRAARAPTSEHRGRYRDCGDRGPDELTAPAAAGAAHRDRRRAGGHLRAVRRTPRCST